MIWKHIFIIGGPGTGKTTTIAKILVALTRMSKKKLKIKLAAPTGKAAARLTESLNNSLNNIQLKKLEKILFPSHAITLHTLLGINKNNNIPFFNSNNLIDIDILIVDESSMIDLWLMAQLINAIPKKSKIIFLGDPNQLPAVQPGSVFKDIYSYHQYAYSISTATLLKNITKCHIKTIQTSENLIINDSICTLNKNYRFNNNSDISRLEKDLKNFNINKIKKIFFNEYKNITYHEINNNKQYTHMLEKIVKKYKKYIQKILNKNNPEKIIKVFHHYRVLCALKNGVYGVKKINENLEQIMQNNNMIQPHYVNDDIWYVGKPIMITENDSSLNLLNGDIGITLLNEKNKLTVFFILKKSILISIPINLLPKHETTWAMTIHKSQGSEFEHVILILPNYNYPILTHEILYTAVTRTCNKLTIYANKKIFLKTILNKNSRYSALSHNHHD